MKRNKKKEFISKKKEFMSKLYAVIGNANMFHNILIAILYNVIGGKPYHVEHELSEGYRLLKRLVEEMEDLMRVFKEYEELRKAIERERILGES